MKKTGKIDMAKAQDSSGVSLSLKSIFLASFFFIFLFSLNFVSADEFVSASTLERQGSAYFPEGYTLNVIIPYEIILGDNVNFRASFYNTAGRIQQNTSASCGLAVHNYNLERTLELTYENFTFIYDGRIIVGQIPSSFMNETGRYIVNFICLDSPQSVGGYFNGEIYVKEPTDINEESALTFNKNIILIVFLVTVGVILFALYLYNRDEYYLPLIAGMIFVLGGIFSFTGLEGFFDKLVVDIIGIFLIGLGLLNLAESIWRFFPND